MFNRLALMYTINCILTPLLVFAFPFGATQAWYEDGGVAQAVLTLIVADAVGSCMRILQIPPLLKRFVLAPLTSTSQPHTTQAWEPEPMFVGAPLEELTIMC